MSRPTVHYTHLLLLESVINVNPRNKINILDNILIQEAPEKLSTQPSTAFEDMVKKHLDGLSKVQKSLEERQFSFEERIEKKLDAFFNGQSHMHGSNSLRQNQTHQLQHKDRARLNDQSRMMQGPSRSSQNHQLQREKRGHCHDVIPDFDGFEEIDQNFPVEVCENVEELEYNIRKDLELKLILVNQKFSKLTTSSVR